MSFEKVFIGKGRQVPNMQVAKVTIPLEKLQEIAYEKEGVMYCTFEVSKMKEADRLGREYTAYYSKRSKSMTLFQLLLTCIFIPTSLKRLTWISCRKHPTLSMWRLPKNC
jgi:hypothetical protein